MRALIRIQRLLLSLVCAAARSLRIDAGRTTVVEAFKQRDWSKYNTLRMYFRNDAATGTGLHFEVVDKHTSYHERHINDFGLQPGESVVDVNFGAGLWRGDENKPYQGKIKTPIDPVHSSRIAIGNNGNAPIFVDRSNCSASRRSRRPAASPSTSGAVAAR